jgi:hypothetical protein
VIALLLLRVRNLRLILESLLHALVLAAGLTLVLSGAPINFYSDDAYRVFNGELSPVWFADDAVVAPLSDKESPAFFGTILILMFVYMALPHGVYRANRLYGPGFGRGARLLALLRLVALLGIVEFLGYALLAALWHPSMSALRVPELVAGGVLIGLLGILEQVLWRRDPARGLAGLVPVRNPTTLELTRRAYGRWQNAQARSEADLERLAATVADPTVSLELTRRARTLQTKQLAVGMAGVAVYLLVLLIGFRYVWNDVWSLVLTLAALLGGCVLVGAVCWTLSRINLSGLAFGLAVLVLTGITSVGAVAFTRAGAVAGVVVAVGVMIAEGGISLAAMSRQEAIIEQLPPARARVTVAPVPVSIPVAAAIPAVVAAEESSMEESRSPATGPRHLLS